MGEIMLRAGKESEGHALAKFGSERKTAAMRQPTWLWPVSTKKQKPQVGAQHREMAPRAPGHDRDLFGLYKMDNLLQQYFSPVGVLPTSQRRQGNAGGRSDVVRQFLHQVLAVRLIQVVGFSCRSDLARGGGIFGLASPECLAPPSRGREAEALYHPRKPLLILRTVYNWPTNIEASFSSSRANRRLGRVLRLAASCEMPILERIPSEATVLEWELLRAPRATLSRSKPIWLPG